MGNSSMEKMLRQFAPFVALVVAAVLVVIADPGQNTTVQSGPGGTPQRALGTGTVARPVTSPETAAPVPVDATAPAADAEPFAGSSTPSVSGSGFSGSSGSSFSSPTPSGSSFTTPAATSFVPA